MAELRQRQPPVKRRRKLTRADRAAEREAQAYFKREVLRLDMGKCVEATALGSTHRCDGPLEAHHVVKAQWLRTHVSTLELSEAEILEWLWSENVGCTLCQRAHTGHTTRMHVVPLEHLPARVIDWCDGRGIGHLLRREHVPLFAKPTA